MPKILVCIAALFMLHTGLHAQLAKTNIPLAAVEQLQMPKQDNAALEAKEKRRRAKKEVPEFAVAVPMTITPEQDGTWETLTDGMDVWRVRIYSEAAKSINLGFSKYVLPPNTQLYLYSRDLTAIQGPFSTADNETHQEFWSPVVMGEELVIEVQVPTTARKDLQLEVSSVNHDFMGFGQASQGCNVDIICGIADGYPEIENFRDVAQSVAMYSLNGTRACTGFLVNNARQDCTPYFVTGAHCGVNTSNVRTIVTYWNYQNDTCRTVNTAQNRARGTGNLTIFNTGAALVSENIAADMELLLLDDPVNEQANAYFAGWDIQLDPPSSTVCIHHPNTEEKRFSSSNIPTFLGTWGLDDTPVENGDHIIVPRWEVGTTEGGSSGSPLFNSAGLVVGQLHGGLASCTRLEYDSYGRWRSAWNTGNPRTSMQSWLDPDQIGMEQLPGKWEQDCDLQLLSNDFAQVACADDTVRYAIAVTGIDLDSATINIDGLPDSLIVDLEQDTANLLLVLSNFQNLSDTSIIFYLSVEDEQRFVENPFRLTVLSKEANPVSLMAPVNNAPAIATSTVFTWERNSEFETYEFQLATDSTFNNILLNETTTNNEYVAADLEDGTVYYWRVRIQNQCITSEWSTRSQFTTANCSTYSSNQIVPISSGSPGNVSSTIAIDEDGVIEDINVLNISGNHTWISDLEFFLSAPAGEELQLMERICGSERNFDLGFDDESTLTNLPCPPVDEQLYQPAEALARFNGQAIRGNWTLRIADNEFQDGGRLNRWALQVCKLSEEVFQTQLSIVASDTLLCDASETTVPLILGQGYNPDSIQVTVETEPFPIQSELIPNPDDSFRPTLRLSNLGFLISLPQPQSLTVLISDGQFSNATQISLSLGSSPAATTLTSPTLDEVLVPSEVAFSWRPDSRSTVEGYQWDLALDEDFNEIVASIETNNTTLTLTDTLIADTVYHWRVTTLNSCGSSIATARFRTSMFSSVTPILDAQQLQLYPNPNSGQFTIETTLSDLLPVVVELYDLNGKQIHRSLQRQVHADYAFEQLPSGLYTVKIVSEQGILVKRVVVE